MKTIYEQVEEEEKLLEQPVEDAIEETPEEPEDEPVEEPSEQPVEPPAAPVQETPVDNAAYARMRFEASEERRKREAAEEELRKQQSKPQTTEPNKEEDREAWLEWKAQQLEEETKGLKQWKEQQEAERQAREHEEAQIRGFMYAENQFKAVAPDYEDVSNHMISRMSESVRLLNPHADDVAVNNFVKKQILTWAEQAAQQGFQPAQYLYNLGKNKFGYQPKAPVLTKQERPNLSIVEKNRKKSASGVGGSSGKSSLTIKALENMSVADMSNMDPEEIDSMLRA
jgi:hypothetical protein